MDGLLKISRVLLLALAVCLQGCATSYSAKEIEAWVIDADTRQPLEGVNVVAHWVLKFGWEGGQSRDLTLMEAVTDKNGRFYFPAWGPTAVPGDLPMGAQLHSQDPEIILFKNGYDWNALYNSRRAQSPERGPSLRTSEWHGKIIPMRKCVGDVTYCGERTNGVLTGVSYGRCGWKRIPKMMASLIREAERHKRLNIYNSLPTLDALEGSSFGDNCGSVAEFFKEYLK